MYSTLIASTTYDTVLTNKILLEQRARASRNFYSCFLFVLAQHGVGFLERFGIVKQGSVLNEFPCM
jgi:hypothetical protein